MKIPRHGVTVDLVVLTIRDSRLQLALIERGIPPFEGQLALPGGFVVEDEDISEAAKRELSEETGLALDTTHLEQLATFGSPQRDPRTRVISVAYLGLVASLGELTAGSDARKALWCPVEELPDLAFDHSTIVAVGLERARAKLEYTTIATKFCPEKFTMAELRSVYQIAWGEDIDSRNFSRKVLGSPGFVVEAGLREGARGRPATLYRAGPATQLQPPIMREVAPSRNQPSKKSRS